MKPKEPMTDQKQETYWQDTGRWAGYEETFDPQSGAWASPQISYLTFKSLIQLRRTMNTGQWRNSVNTRGDCVTPWESNP